MRKIVLAAFAAAVLFCLPAWATGEQQTTLNAAVPSKGIGIVNGSTTCGSTALLFATPGVGTMRILATGTFTSGNIRVQASVDATNFTGDLTVYPRAGGAGATTIAAAGDFTLPILGDMYLCIYGSSFTGAATVQVGFAPVATRVIVSNTSADPLFVTGSLSVSGTADVVSAGAPTTFNNTAICTGSLLTAGEQSAGFHLDSGTLGATFTPQCSSATSGTTNFTNGQFSDRLGAKTDTLVVTNPNAQVDLTIVCPGVTRRVQVCTTAFTSGSATGLANATFLQAAAATGGGGGGVVTQPTGSNLHAQLDTGSTTAVTQATGTNLHTVTDATSVTAATQSGTWTLQPGNTANTTAWKVDNSAVNQPVIGTKTNNAAAPGATNIGALPCVANAAAPTWTEGDLVFCSVDLAGNQRMTVTSTVNSQGLGTAGSPSGGVGTMQGQAGMTPLDIENKPGDILAANAADRSAAATLLSVACTSTAACGSTTSIQWSAAGTQSAELTITAISSPVGITVACDKGYDTFNTTFVLPTAVLAQDCVFWNGTSRKATLANADLVAGTQWAIYWSGSPSTIRARLATVTGGSVTLAGRSTLALGPPFPVEAKPPTQNAVTLTASTAETTLLATGGSGVFLDLTELTCHTTSATGNVITLRPATGATCPTTAGCRTIICPASTSGTPCEGWVWRTPWAQASSNNNWTIQASGSTSSVQCEVQAVQR